MTDVDCRVYILFLGLEGKLHVHMGMAQHTMQWHRKMLGGRGAGWVWCHRCKGCEGVPPRSVKSFLTYFSAHWRSHLAT